MTALLTELPTEKALTEHLRREVAKSFVLANRRETRDQTELSLSKLGGCTREAAYRLADTEPDPEWDSWSDEKRAAWLGTWQHRGLLPLLRLRLRRSRTEVPVVLSGSGLQLPGRADLWWRSATLLRKGIGDVVVDGKTKAAYGLDWVRRDGPRPRDVLQTRGYAMALRQTWHADVRWTATVYIDRASGDTEVTVQPFGPAEAVEVMDRLHELSVEAVKPHLAPRDERGPGLSIICDGCPWLRQCWGKSATPGDAKVQSILATDPDAISSALTMYEDSRLREKRAGEDKEFARAILEGQPPGRYGDLVLSWGRASKGGNLSKPKSWDAMIEAGVDLASLADTSGAGLQYTAPGSPSIGVRRAKEGE